MDIQVTLLVENTAKGKGILGEHGLAWWIQSQGRNLLFDTGQGMVLEANAQRLGIALSQADAICLSHGHYDHVGGLASVLELCPVCPIWAHPHAFQQKFSVPEVGKGRCISVPLLHEQKLAPHQSRLRDASLPTEIIPAVFCTGEIPRRTTYEDTGGPFFLNIEAEVPDPILDDLSLYFDTPGGVVVVLGCAHAGLVNILHHIRNLTGRPIHTVMGGMHLELASPERLEATVRELKDLQVKTLFPCHCTGHFARIHLHNALPGKVLPCAASSTWRF